MRLSATSNPPGMMAQRERDRIDALWRFDLPDGAHREAFDRIARLASLALSAPAGGVSLVDVDRVRFAGRHGVPVSEFDRTERSFCQHVNLDRELLVVGDASQDARFTYRAPARLRLGRSVGRRDTRSHTLCAGAPILVGDHVLGSVWVLDHEPRAGLASEALAEIAAQSGRQFDPLVVGAFLRLMSTPADDISAV